MCEDGNMGDASTRGDARKEWQFHLVTVTKPQLVNWNAWSRATVTIEDVVGWPDSWLSVARGVGVAVIVRAVDIGIGSSRQL